MTLRYVRGTDFAHEAGVEALPYIEQVDYSPGIISLGENSLGQRASLSITFVGEPSPDTGPGGDKYLADRPYNP